MKLGLSVLFCILILALAGVAYAAEVSDFPTPSSIKSPAEAVRAFWPAIVEICTLHWHLDPYMVAGLVEKESEFIPTAVNLGEKQACASGFTGFPCPVPGSGLTQITGPWVAGTPLPREVEYQYNMPREAVRIQAPIVHDLFDPRQNLQRGCWYLNALMNHYSNDKVKTLQAYRNGFFGVDAGTGLAETSYSTQVLGYRAQYMSTAGMTESRLNTLLGQIDPKSVATGQVPQLPLAVLNPDSSAPQNAQTPVKNPRKPTHVSGVLPIRPHPRPSHSLKPVPDSFRETHVLPFTVWATLSVAVDTALKVQETSARSNLSLSGTVARNNPTLFGSVLYAADSAPTPVASTASPVVVPDVNTPVVVDTNSSH